MHPKLEGGGKRHRGVNTCLSILSFSSSPNPPNPLLLTPSSPPSPFKISTYLHLNSWIVELNFQVWHLWRTQHHNFYSVFRNLEEIKRLCYLETIKCLKIRRSFFELQKLSDCQLYPALLSDWKLLIYKK